jgi:hypothetical protein
MLQNINDILIFKIKHKPIIELIKIIIFTQQPIYWDPYIFIHNFFN